MFPSEYDYHRASSAQEAIDLLGRNENAKLLAGGHSLIPMMKLHLVQPALIIDIGRINELRGVCKEEGSIRIGALTTHAALASDQILHAECALLAEAAGTIGDPQVRNKGTIGGNIAHADPASDLPAVLVALEAKVHILGPEGERIVAAKDFFVDLLTSDLTAREIVTQVEVPALGPTTGSAYLKVEHPASGYAVCGAAALVTMAGGQCSAAGLAFNGVGHKPISGAAVLAAIVGSPADDATIDNAVDEHLSVEDPLGDIHASGEYRLALAKAYGKRGLKKARDRATQT
jgi:carbon-monoxide dehydrogenase medium subunit